MPETLFDLNGKVAIVTGAAHGLGRAIARGLANQGAAVALLDRDAAACEETRGVLVSAGWRASAYACDVGREDDVRGTVAQVIHDFSHVDILVNNAGITKRIALFHWEEADWNEVIRVNQIGTFLMCREVGRHMVARRSGSIVNVSALGGGMIGLGRGNAVYCATKGAIAAMTRDFAAEWASHGIRVNAVAPGWFRTDMNRPLLADSAVLARILDRVPLGRLGEPEDIVGPVVFLASDAARMITGHLMPIDGGVASIVKISDAPVID